MKDERTVRSLKLILVILILQHASIRVDRAILAGAVTEDAGKGWWMNT